MAFQAKITKATRTKCAASIQIEGLSGKGKSGTALLIALALSDNNVDNLLAVDTEKKSLNLFEGLELTNGIKMPPFDVIQLSPEDGFSPSNYIACKQAAKEAGKKVLILDSMSHAWQYQGGILDIVARLKATQDRYKRDAYAVWNDPEVVAEKNKLFEMVRDDNMHIISTVRVKEKMEYTTENGKPKLISLGEQQIMQTDLKYEFDLVLHCLRQGSTKNGNIQYPLVRVIKSRYAIFVEDEEYELTPEVLEQLRKYLAEGVDPAEIQEQQRQDYIKALKELLKNPQKKSVAEVVKEDAGYKENKFSELPLPILKRIYATVNN